MPEQVLCAIGMQDLWMSEEGSGTGITGDYELPCEYENPTWGLRKSSKCSLVPKVENFEDVLTIFQTTLSPLIYGCQVAS